jgi:undecaprenyl-diphosphatase
MSIIQAFILGAIQGIAEFLPISSSGHLEVAQYFFKLKEVPLLFDVLLHVGTLAAVCVVFRKRIIELLAVLWRLVIRKPNETDTADRKTILALVIATAVTGVIGFAIKDIAKTFPLLYISCAFVVTGILLFFSSRYKSKNAVTVPGPLQSLVI